MCFWVGVKVTWAVATVKVNQRIERTYFKFIVYVSAILLNFLRSYDCRVFSFWKSSNSCLVVRSEGWVWRLVFCLNNLWQDKGTDYCFWFFVGQMKMVVPYLLHSIILYLEDRPRCKLAYTHIRHSAKAWFKCWDCIAFPFDSILICLWRRWVN